ncbi:unnamed protein product [Microthlaspi erraticum]|uniref:Retrotransposon gag domain-containing protein n=1 Tax=Microthlaspi erraticum TaxID=1685480 RepID=A0A6D2KM03_9BRAS|nr:unnamed protein product [Microthlaspi erraticum]
MDIPEGNGNPLGNGNGRARQTRPIGLGDAPNRHQQRRGIVPPPVQNHNFEIKLGMITLVQNKMFHGLSCEDPIDHLDEFDRLCDLTKMNGVSEDAIKLRLFPMSLGDKAHQWEKSLPHGSITTWEDCKKAFLAKFFSTGRTAKLRSEISGFTQRNNETFAEAWERFKGYTSQCPHHGFSNESLLSTLYRGVLPRYKEMLDTASNGNFLNQDVDDGWQLVENIANSSGSYGEEYDRTNRSSTSNSIESDSKLRNDVKALNEKLDTLILAQSTMKKANFVSKEEMVQGQEEEENQFAEVCYIKNGQGGYQNGYYGYKSHPTMSYSNTDVANPQDQVYPPQQQAPASQPPQQGYGQKGNFQGHQGNYQGQQQSVPTGYAPQAPQASPSQEQEIKAMLKQLLQGQADGAMEISKKLAEMNSKIESLNTRVHSLEHHASSSAAKQGQFPGKAVQNPKEHCRAIFTQEEGFDQQAANEKDIEEICMLLNNEDNVVADAPGVQYAQPEVQAPQIAIHASPVELAQQARSSQTVSPARSSQMLYAPTPSDDDTYKPPVPFPSRILTKNQKKVITKFRNDMSKIGVELPNMGSFQAAHVQKKMIKDILDNKDEVAQLLEPSSSQGDLLSTPTSLPKLNGQGSFTLPCTLGHLQLEDALVDSGASINLISLVLIQKLGIQSLIQRPKSSIMFGDASSKAPLGIVMDFPLRIGECTIPIDLTVLDMVDEKDVPLILGTPFLTTVGASIDFHTKKVILHNVNSKVSYPLKASSSKYCGTIATKSLSIKGDEFAEVEKMEIMTESSTEPVICEPCVLDEMGLAVLFSEQLGSAQKDGEGMALKASPGHKRKMITPQTLSSAPSQLTLTLLPSKFTNGKIEYKIKCKRKSKPFSSINALVSPELQKDQTKLKELLSSVLTVTFDGGTALIHA